MPARAKRCYARQMSHSIFFDLDGTLTDPFEGISKSIIYALEKLGEPVPRERDLRRWIGPPLLESFGAYIGSERAPEALDLYRERFSDVGWRENRPYDGIESVLDELRGKGHVLYVATSKPHVYARRIVEHFGLDRYFERVFGPELDGTRNSKTALLQYALAECAIDGCAVMIGDRKHDMIGASNNGMTPIGVSYGYGTVAELQDAGAYRIATSPQEIPEQIK